MIARAFGWGSGMALVRLLCSFVSIKVTAVVLGPSGLALVAQLAGFVMLMQSMLGQGLVTGSVREGAEQTSRPGGRPDAVYATAARMALWLVGCAGVVMWWGAAPLAGWLLHDEALAPLMVLAILAVAAAIGTDLLNGALGVSKEVGLIAVAGMSASVLGLAVFAPSAWRWGLEGALWGSLAVFVAAFALTAAWVGLRSRGVRLAAFVGPIDRAMRLRLLRYVPMLVVHGALPPLALILVRDTLASSLGLHAAGLWQAAWRLSEAAQAIVISSIALHFMPSLGEWARDRVALRRRVLRTLAAAVGVTAALGLSIAWLREPIVRIVLSADFAPVAALLPLQLAGDVLRMAGWILMMVLVGTLRSRAFVVITALSALSLVGLSRAWVPWLGVQGVMWAHMATGALQLGLAAWALRDLLLQGTPMAPPGPSVPRPMAEDASGPTAPAKVSP